MKKSLTLISIMVLFVLLQSCSSNNDAEKQKASADQIYTSVAGSLTAQAASQPTATVKPQSTATQAPTQAPLVIPTLAQVEPTTVANPVGCDNLAYISDVTIADGTAITPGATFTKTWRVQNTGSCDWTTGYQLAFSTGDIMSGATVYIPYTIPVGKQIDLSVNLTAPTTLGTYKGYWKLKNPGGSLFGSNLYVEIVVANSTATPTSTFTPTTATTATSTTEPSATTAPTTETTTSS